MDRIVVLGPVQKDGSSIVLLVNVLVVMEKLLTATKLFVALNVKLVSMAASQNVADALTDMAWSRVNAYSVNIPEFEEATASGT